MTVIGLTGGIASGKSAAAAYLEELGAFVIDADKLGHRAYEPGQEAWRQVIEAFGRDIVGLDQRIDRKALGAKVFGDADGMRRLTDIVWPQIRRLAEEEMQRADGRVVVLEAAVLLEAGWDAITDEVWVVMVSPDIAIQRAMKRDGLDREEVQKRMDAQMGNIERVTRATRLFDNSADLPNLHQQLTLAWQHLISTTGSGAGGNGAD